MLMQMQPDKYRGVGDALKETLAKHGPMGLYKGVGAPLVGNGFYNAVQFAIFGSAKKFVTGNGAHTEPWRVAAAGAFTGIFVALVEGPQDLFKSQIQATMVTKAAPDGVAAAAGKPKYAGVADCARQIIAQRGLAGASQGLTATVARNIVGVSAYFYFYEVVRSTLAGKTRRVEDLSALEVLAAGFSGGCVCRAVGVGGGGGQGAVVWWVLAHHCTGRRVGALAVPPPPRLVVGAGPPTVWLLGELPARE